MDGLIPPGGGLRLRVCFAPKRLIAVRVLVPNLLDLLLLLMGRGNLLPLRLHCLPGATQNLTVAVREL